MYATETEIKIKKVRVVLVFSRFNLFPVSFLSGISIFFSFVLSFLFLSAAFFVVHALSLSVAFVHLCSAHAHCFCTNIQLYIYVALLFSMNSFVSHCLPLLNV